MMARSFLVHVAVLGTFGMKQGIQTSRQHRAQNLHVDTKAQEDNSNSGFEVNIGL